MNHYGTTTYPRKLVSLILLILLQAVLGFDNLLYISLESRRTPAEKQAMVRRMGIGIAIILRIALLFLLVELIQYFQDPTFNLNLGHMLASSFNLHSVIVLGGDIMLLSEGGHLAQIELFGEHITPMGKTTFYFVIIVLVVTDVVQTRNKRKIMVIRQAQVEAVAAR